jgi:hypothetical protein
VPHNPQEPWPVRRSKTFNVRIEPELCKAAFEKANAVGLTVVVRAFLRANVGGAIQPPDEDLSKELQWAPRRVPSRRKPRTPAK